MGAWITRSTEVFSVILVDDSELKANLLELALKMRARTHIVFKVQEGVTKDIDIMDKDILAT